MAVVATNIIANGSGTDGSSFATASITPAANALILLTFVSRRGDSTNPAEPTASGNGLTWVVVQSVVFDDAGTSRRRLTVFRAMGTSPTAGAITISCGATQTSGDWSVDQFSGVDVSGTNGSGAVVQSVQNSDASDPADVSSLTVTLAAFGSSLNATFGAFGMFDGSLTSTAGTGFTKLGDSTDGDTGSRVTTEFRSDNDTSVDMSFSDVAQIGGVAVEIKAYVELADTVKGVFGEFKPVLEPSEGTFTANQVQGVFGEFKPVIDSAQGAAAGTAVKDIIGMGFIPFAR